MQILNKNLKKGQLKVKISSPEDLWYLTYLINSGDSVRGTIVRKINLGGEGEKARIVKKPMTVTITVEKLEYKAQEEQLRIQGTITDGPDDLSKGSHQSITAGINDEISIEKPEAFLSFQIEKLDQAVNESKEQILITIHDREQAIFALLKNYKYEIISALKGDVKKKAFDESGKDFYAEIAKEISNYNQRYKPSHIVLASPSFFKEYTNEKIDQEIKKKIVLATCSSVTDNAIQELISRGEIKTVMAQNRIAFETDIVNRFLENISRSDKVAYGFDETSYAVDAGASEILLVSEELIEELRDNDQFAKLEQLMKKAESTGAKIMIISGSHEAGGKLSSLGGVGAILRYNIK